MPKISRGKAALSYLRRDFERIKQAHKQYESIPKNKRTKEDEIELIRLSAQWHMMATNIDIVYEIVIRGVTSLFKE